MGSKSASTLGSHSLSEDTAGDGGGGGGSASEPAALALAGPCSPPRPHLLFMSLLLPP